MLKLVSDAVQLILHSYNCMVAFNNNACLTEDQNYEFQRYSYNYI